MEKQNKKSTSMVKWMMITNLASVIFVGIMLTIMCSVFIYLIIDEDYQKIARTGSIHMASMLDNLDEGDYSYDSETGKFYKGSVEITDKSFLDIQEKDQNLQHTIFWGDTRILTDVKDSEGNTVLGTKLNNPTIESEMQKNGIYVESNILLYGKRYSVCYYPLCNGGQMVGMVFTGVNQEAANQQIVRAILLFIVILTILAGGISLILVQQIRKRSGIFGKYLTNASVIAGDKKKSVTELGLYTKQNMEQINDAIEEVTKAVTEQANNTEEIMGSMEEFASSIDIIMGQVQTTSDVAGNSIHRIEELQDRLNILESVSETNSQEIISISKQIEEDSYAVGEISKIINAINDIAFQITILSFNASVEAARAGEAGKGFGVVADSIKDLSDKTKASLEDITHIVQSVNEKMAETTQASEKLQKENQKVVEALVQTKQQLQEVTNSFHEITGHLSDIMDESGIIVASKNQVVETVSSLAAASEENAAMSQEVKATADEVISATDHLIGEIERLQDIVTLMDEVQEEFSSQKIKQ